MTVSKAIRSHIPHALSVVTIILAYISTWKIVDSPLIVPGPDEIVSAMTQLSRSGVLWKGLAGTMGRVCAGFALSMSAGTALGFVGGKSRAARDFLRIPMTLLRTTPAVAVVMVLIFTMKSSSVPVAVGILMTLPAVTGTVAAGFDQTKHDSQMLEMARVFGLTKTQTAIHIRIPKIGPFIKAAAKTSFGMTWKVVAAGEVICLPRDSLGTILSTAQVHLETAQTFAIALTISAACLLMEGLLSLAMRGLTIAAGRLSSAAVGKKKVLRMNPGNPADIEIRDLSVTAGGKTIISGYTQTFTAGKTTAIVSPSGTGKTTLLNHISRTTSGVSYCFQEPRLIESLTALQNASLPPGTDTEDARRILESMGMADRLHSRCSSLSGGERQRVNLARSLAYPSRTLLLDESLSAIDDGTRKSIMDLMKQMQTSNPRTVILVTHSQEEADRLSDIRTTIPNQSGK